MLAICANLCRCVLPVSLCLQKFLIRLHLLWKISRSFYKKTCIFFEKSLPLNISFSCICILYCSLEDGGL